MTDDKDQLTAADAVGMWLSELAIRDKHAETHTELHKKHLAWLRKVVYVEKAMSVVMIVLLSLIVWRVW